MRSTRRAACARSRCWRGRASRSRDISDWCRGFPTRRGGLRIVGRTAEEALELAEDFRRLENAGAYAAEVECVAAEALAAIAARSRLVTPFDRRGGRRATSSSCFSSISAANRNGRPDTPGHSPTCRRFAGESSKSAAAPSATTGPPSWTEATRTQGPSVSMLPNEHDKLLEALDARSEFPVLGG